MPTLKSVEFASDAPVLITMGDPSGIGPEIAADTFAALDGRIAGRPIMLVGDPDVFTVCADVPADAIIPTKARAVRKAGKLDPENAPATIEAIELAVAMAMAGKAAALVTAPIHKAVLMETGFAFPGHTDFLAKLTGAKRAVMMLASDELRVVPVTAHIPLKEVPVRLTRETIVETGEIVLESLKRDYGITRPRLAVAGLNPHAGESGRLGSEEIDIIIPAIEALKAKGAKVAGPLPSDTMFHATARIRYDAALCMYHDQALIPLKTLSFWEGINVTLGLPIVRTSPDHGTGLDIAGRGIADARSMIAAVKLAAKMADARSR
jgi:4-hydroxythreonine-4-phosphate dehydrogenase